MSRPIITIDLEEWFHFIETDAVPAPARWIDLESRVQINTEQLLDLLQRFGVKATVFVLGWVAENHPGLVRTIAEQGHDIGCHSYFHTPVHSQTREAFRQETARALDTIQMVIGRPVLFYRAPGFSLYKESLWVFEILTELGVRYDSSCFPGRHSHGGLGRSIPSVPFRIPTPNGELREFPISLHHLWGLDVPRAGGGFFRLMPFALTAHWCKERDYLMTYFHPRDFDPGQPILDGLPPVRRFKSYVGLGGALRKLEKFVQTFGGQSMAEADVDVRWGQSPELRLEVATKGMKHFS